MILGDITVMPGNTPPARLLAGFAALGKYLRPLLIDIGWSHTTSCIASSLTTREFLFRLGFRDAEVRPVFFYIEAVRDGEIQHTLGVGPPGDRDVPNGWAGHLVCVLPETGWLIDPTLFQAQREQWWPGMTGMVAAPLIPAGRMWDMDVLTVFGAVASNGNTVSGAWLDRPDNTGWKTAPDARRSRRHIRVAIANNLIRKLEKDSA